MSLRSTVGLLAVYLPMLPAFIWTFALIKYIEKLLALILMIPSWFLGHIIPEQGGLINSVGRPGYILLASVLLRPIHMVFAIHLSMVMLGGIGFILTDMLTAISDNMNANYTAGVAVGLGSFVIYSGFLVVVTHVILNWTFQLPDEFSHYVGGSGGGFGESESKGHMGGIAGMVQQKGETGISQMMKPGNKPSNQMKLGSSGFA